MADFVGCQKAPHRQLTIFFEVKLVRAPSIIPPSAGGGEVIQLLSLEQGLESRLDTGVEVLKPLPTVSDHWAGHCLEGF